jgi:hypothetical protein
VNDHLEGEPVRPRQVVKPEREPFEAENPYAISEPPHRSKSRLQDGGDMTSIRGKVLLQPVAMFIFVNEWFEWIQQIHLNLKLN